MPCTSKRGRKSCFPQIYQLIWTNLFCHFNKYIYQFGLIYFAIYSKHCRAGPSVAKGCFPKVQNIDVCAPNNVFLSFDILNTQQQKNAEHKAGKCRIVSSKSQLPQGVWNGPRNKRYRTRLSRDANEWKYRQKNKD